MKLKFSEKVNEIISNDKRYKADAYEFVMQALAFTQKKLKKNDHVSGKEILTGIKGFALEQYGPLTKALMEYWGIYTTIDFGNIVFNMINMGLMKKTEDDSLDDFKDGYDFKEAFNCFKLKTANTKRKVYARK